MCVSLALVAVKFSFSFLFTIVVCVAVKPPCCALFVLPVSGLWSRCHWNRWIDYQHFVAMGFGVLCDLGDQSEHSHCSSDPGDFGNLKCS